MREMATSVIAGIDHALRGMYIDANPDVGATSFVAGTGRSGTAWAANIANFDGASRYMFEPFNPYRVPICHAFRYRQYLRPDDDDPRFVEPAHAIVTGRVRNAWIDQFNRAVYSRSRVIKEIRANLMLKWLKNRFPGLRIVLMLRHPCADANSRLQLGWSSHLDEMLAQSALVDDHLAPFVAAIERARSPFEKHVFLWCIENYVALRQLASGDAHLVFYENLCVRPKTEVESLFAYLGRPIVPGVFRRLARPSELVREESAIRTGGDLVEAWREHVPPEAIDSAMRIVALFGLDAIYQAQVSLPDVEGARSLLRGTPQPAIARPSR
jgi:hypothetical protein